MQLIFSLKLVILGIMSLQQIKKARLASSILLDGWRHNYCYQHTLPVYPHTGVRLGCQKSLSIAHVFGKPCLFPWYKMTSLCYCNVFAHSALIMLARSKPTEWSGVARNIQAYWKTKQNRQKTAQKFSNQNPNRFWRKTTLFRFLKG